MKKILTQISLGIIAISTLCGCSAIKEWFNSTNFTTVVSVVSPALKTASSAVVYAVCKKNTDLNPIFIAAANGIKIAINNSDYSTDQIKSYIKQALGNDSETWYPIVETSMDTVLSWYNAIYTKYFDIKDSTCIQGFSTLLTSFMDGVIAGASTTTSSSMVCSTYIQAKSQEVNALDNLKEVCEQFDITID